jgi:hypothetical protein
MAGRYRTRPLDSELCAGNDRGMNSFFKGAFPTLLALALAPALLAPPLAHAEPVGRWYAVQLHAHSRYSDGLHPIGELVRWAKEGGLDALAITDHNTLAHLKDDVYQHDQGITLIPAYEWTEGMDGPHGHAAAHQLKERCHISVWGLRPDTPLIPFTFSKAQVVMAAAKQGVTLGANHPFEPRFPWPDEDFTGISTVEVWQWQYGDDESPAAGSARPSPAALHAPQEGLLQAAFLVRNARAQALWQKVLASGHHLTPVAVCDFHIGGPIQSLVSPCTLIWSRTGLVDDLLANLRAGHVCLVDKPHGPRCEIWADTRGYGAFDAMAGDEVAIGTNLAVKVHDGAGDRLTIRDAKGIIVTQDVTTSEYRTQFKATRAGFYWARLDRRRAYNPIESMSGALYVKALPQAKGP